MNLQDFLARGRGDRITHRPHNGVQIKSDPALSVLSPGPEAATKNLSPTKWNLPLARSNPRPGLMGASPSLTCEGAGAVSGAAISTPPSREPAQAHDPDHHS